MGFDSLALPIKQRSKNFEICVCVFFPQQQNAMGSLHNIDFGVCWASWGGSGKKKGFREGSGKVPGTVPGTGSDGFRGLDRFQGSEVWVGSRVPRFG